MSTSISIINSKHDLSPFVAAHYISLGVPEKSLIHVIEGNLEEIREELVSWLVEKKKAPLPENATIILHGTIGGTSGLWTQTVLMTVDKTCYKYEQFDARRGIVGLGGGAYFTVELAKTGSINDLINENDILVQPLIE